MQKHHDPGGWTGAGRGVTQAAGRGKRPFCRKRAKTNAAPDLPMAHRKQGIRPMPDVTIVYWRDIPAQVIVGKGRRGTKVQLPERFEQAIDRAAMKSGAAETDDYLAEWRRGDPVQVGDDLEAEAQTAMDAIEKEYDKDRLVALVKNGGREA